MASDLTISHDIRTLDGMASKTTTVLVDDLTGEAADTTVRFALDSREYELDLTEKNGDELRDALSRYVQAARKVSGGRRSALASKSAFSEIDPAAVRAWAAGQGIEVSPRGRISKTVIEQYRAAGN
jgi:Lsr2